MGVLNILLPTRFILTMAHLILAILLFETKDANVNAALAKSASVATRDSANQEMVAIVALILTCCIIDLLGLMGGFSLFMPLQHCFQIITHFIGVILLSFFTLDSWHYRSGWYLWGFLSLPEAAIEAFIIGGVALCKWINY